MALRLRLPRPEDFRSLVHDVSVTSRVGRALGVAIAVCFVTGLISHNASNPDGYGLGPFPVWGYRLNQGLHVTSGLAAIPLLLAKLYAVYPRLFNRPLLPRPNRAGLLIVLERGSIAVLVGAALFEVTSGLFNITQWYAFGFFFVPVHYAVAWVLAGSLLVHLAVKLPLIRRALTRGAPVPRGDRRGFVLGALGVAGGLTLLTVGQAFTPLSRLAVLAPRQPGRSAVQGVPINKTAEMAGVRAMLADPRQTARWRMTLEGPGGTRELTLDDLAALPQVTARLPISCVEGWSVSAEWTGVRIRDLVELAGGGLNAEVTAVSLERGSPYSQAVLQATYASDPASLLALRINGEVLDLDHGFPARVIAPNRPGVLQTKWVERLVVSGEGS